MGEEKWDIHNMGWKGKGYCPCGTGMGSKLYEPTACNAKIVRKEPLLSSERASGLFHYMDNTTNWNIDSEMVPWYLYQCENGHMALRHEGWVDVPTVPIGTMKSTYGSVNKPPKWYTELSDEEKDKV
ncbi:MAG: hypothetical protein SVM80_01825 [Halobacteriota archaeon]|nr:hypothetical protein [Halobacteriota archaeon]